MIMRYYTNNYSRQKNVNSNKANTQKKDDATYY